MEESKRLKKLRGEIIKVIPKFPNNRDTKDKLEHESLTALLIHYLNWVIRYISVKPRMVSIEPTVTSDQRWKTLKPLINALLHKVSSGEDLTPHLSLRPHSRGYSPATSGVGAGVDRWADKDFLLNVMGFHHFHLGTELGINGHVERTDEILFARVTRDKFVAVGIFDHSVFEPASEEMRVERQRLWEIFDGHTTRGARPGSIVMPPPIATSGHPVRLVRTAQDYFRVMCEIDPKLDDPVFVKELYHGTGAKPPTKPKLEWHLNFSDLGVYEKRSGHLFVLRRGFN